MNILSIISFSALIAINYSCTNPDPICECFETRLKIKELLQSANGDIDQLNKISVSSEYIALKTKKEECQNKIEPEYFKKNNLNREGRNDKEFLLEELGDCEAVKKLFKE